MCITILQLSALNNIIIAKNLEQKFADLSEIIVSSPQKYKNI